MVYNGVSMGKNLFIAEKPSVAREFAKVLGAAENHDGYIMGGDNIITWCFGHLVTMSYPEEYDPALKNWKFDTLPFLPKEYKYELIPSAAKQFKVIKSLLNDKNTERIYVCTDSGREGEYIYRLVDMMAKVPDSKDKRRVWIDSQTEEEIKRGIAEAKPLSSYDNLSDSAFLRAKEDYLMGINFSRALTLKYRNVMKTALNTDKPGPVAVGRVMTCVLGMVVRREREIREFVKTPYYRVFASFGETVGFSGEFKAVEGSKYYMSPLLYKENGFKELTDARGLVETLGCIVPPGLPLKAPEDAKEKYSETHKASGLKGVIEKIEKKSEKKNPPLLFNLAELQNECSKIFKISPDDTLKIVQELYEKKLVTYPRTDARVLSTAVAKEIDKNISGLSRLDVYKEYCGNILSSGSYKNIAKTKYVNDSQITDHYAIIPTGQGFNNLGSLSQLQKNVYDKIVRRFLSVFYPSAVYKKLSIIVKVDDEKFFANFKALESKGYLEIAGMPDSKKAKEEKEGDDDDNEEVFDENMLAKVSELKSGSEIALNSFSIKEAQTSPPSRYNSGSLILAMENAGKFIEDEELRALIKGSGIGTSATRAEILKKLVTKEYLNLNKKTQIITPTLTGELIYEVVYASIRSLLNAELTASWEKGLTGVADGNITSDEYMEKLEAFVSKWTESVRKKDYSAYVLKQCNDIKNYYKASKSKAKG